MGVSSFNGVMAEIEAEAKAAAAPPPAEPAAAPVAPAAAVPPVAEASKPVDVPRGTEPAPDAPVTPPAQPTATERRKLKLKGKVAGEDKEWEVDEDALDETRNPEAYKKLVEIHQRSEDYDRPGGALDQRAAKLAEQKAMAWMVNQGWFIKDADGKLVENPLVPGFREYVAAKAKGVQPVASVASPQAPAVPALSERQSRIAALKKAYETTPDKGGGLDGNELTEMFELLADERYDSKETAKEKTAREARERETAEATTRQTAAARLTAEQQANQTFWEGHLSAAVAANNEKFRDPLTGQIDQEYVDAAKARWEKAVRETRDPVAARTLFDQIAASHATKLKNIVDKSIRVPTAAAPAPVSRGSAGAPGQPDDKDTFDYSKGFAKQGGRLAEWEKRHVGSPG